MRIQDVAEGTRVRYTHTIVKGNAVSRATVEGRRGREVAWRSPGRRAFIIETEKGLDMVVAGYADVEPVTVPEIPGIYLLIRTSEVNRDEMITCVVIAASEDRARQHAADNAKDERAGAWWMPTTLCERLGDCTKGGLSPDLVCADIFES